MRVVVTRPAQEALRWVDALRANGHEAEALPLIAIRPVPDPAPLQAAWRDLGGHAAAMFVSAHAVQGFFAAGAAWPPGVRAWAPGPATAAALRAAGVPADQVDAPVPDAAQFDSESLWQVVAGQLGAGDRLLLVRGAGADGQARGREWLSQQLAAAGVGVDTVVAYARGLPSWTDHDRQRARAAADGSAVWLFSSSEAAANLAQLLPGQGWHRARALASHPRIAAAVRALGFGYVAETRPGLGDVVASIESAG